MSSTFLNNSKKENWERADIFARNPVIDKIDFLSLLKFIIESACRYTYSIRKFIS